MPVVKALSLNFTVLRCQERTNATSTVENARDQDSENIQQGIWLPFETKNASGMTLEVSIWVGGLPPDPDQHWLSDFYPNADCRCSYRDQPCRQCMRTVRGSCGTSGDAVPDAAVV